MNTATYNPYSAQNLLNPYATQNGVTAAQLAQLGGQVQDPAGSQLAVSPVTGASLKGLGANSSPVSAAPLAALGGAAGAASTGGSILGSAGGAAAKGGGLAGGLQTAGSAVGILGGLANIYLGFKAAKLAKRQFGFQKDAYNNNLVNSVQTYNTSLEDRVRARHNTESRSASETNSYLSNNRLTANTI